MNLSLWLKEPRYAFPLASVSCAYSLQFEKIQYKKKLSKRKKERNAIDIQSNSPNRDDHVLSEVLDNGRSLSLKGRQYIYYYTQQAVGGMNWRYIRYRYSYPPETIVCDPSSSGSSGIILLICATEF